MMILNETKKLNVLVHVQLIFIHVCVYGGRERAEHPNTPSII